MAALNPLDNITTQFTDYYYQTFDTNREGLAPLYRESSMLTWEGTQHQGVQPIMEKLLSLSFTQVAHKVTTRDPQPTADGGIIILVTGLLLIDGGENPMNYSQTFYLKQDAGNYYVQHDLFRLNLG